MATRATALLLVLVVVACAAAAAAKSPSGGGIRKVVGGRTEVRDVEGNKEVQELGRFSVEEHNRRRGRVEEENSCCGGDGDVGVRLEFGRVIAAQRQVVSGLKYYLRVAAAEESGSGAGQENGGGEPRVFDAVVVVKPWLESRTLLKFAPAVDSPNEST